MNGHDDAERLRAANIRHLPFLCVANSARSQMAEGIARALAPASVKVSSAGSRPSNLHAFAVKALAEVGIDISGHRSKSVNDITADDVDARPGAFDAARVVPAKPPIVRKAAAAR